MGEPISLDDADACFMGHVEGLYAGMLDEDEMRVFNDLCRRGLMKRSYEHPGGFIGLAKVVMTDAGFAALERHLAPRPRPASPSNQKDA